MIWKYILYALLAVVLGYILLMIVSAYCFVNGKKEYEKNSRFFRWLLNSSTDLLVVLCNIGIKVTGLENVPKEGRFVIVGNHRSNYDPILTWHVLRNKDIAYISKASNFNIPIWGRIIRKCCFMAIDREDPRKAMTTISKASKLIKQDEVSIGIYPEGTRSKTGKLLPFHSGSLKIAKIAEVPIVVVAIQGTETIHKRVPFRRSHVKIDFLETIPAERVKKEKTTELSEEIRRTLADHFGEILEDTHENEEA